MYFPGCVKTIEDPSTTRYTELKTKRQSVIAVKYDNYKAMAGGLAKNDTSDNAYISKAFCGETSSHKLHKLYK